MAAIGLPAQFLESVRILRTPDSTQYTLSFRAEKVAHQFFASMGGLAPHIAQKELQDRTVILQIGASDEAAKKELKEINGNACPDIDWEQCGGNEIWLQKLYGNAVILMGSERKSFPIECFLDPDDPLEVRVGSRVKFHDLNRVNRVWGVIFRASEVLEEQRINPLKEYEVVEIPQRHAWCQSDCIIL